MSSIRKKTIVLLIGFFVSFLLSIINIQLWVNRADLFGREINVAGKERMLSQRILKELLLIKSGVNHKKQLLDAMAEFERLINALIYGDNNLSVKPIFQHKIKQACKEVLLLWKDYKNMINNATVKTKISDFEWSSLDRLSVKIFRKADQVVKMLENRSIRSIRSLSKTAYMIFVFSIIIMGLSFFYMKSSIIDRILSITHNTENIARYNLDSTIIVKGRDEIRRLGDSLKNLVSSWKSIVERLINITSSLSVVSAKIWTNLNHNIKKLNEQNEKTSYIVSSVDELSTTITDIAKNASRTSELSKAVTTIAEEAMTEMDNAVIRIIDLGEASNKLSTMVNRLDSKIGKIGEITDIISDIANQTNLLALNAAIEAARAGEKGKGFAVVADEVRKLADKTMKSIDDITELISEINADSKQTTVQMKVAKEKLEESVDLVNHNKEALEKILNHARLSEDEITKVASAVEEQSQTTMEINRALKDTSNLSKMLNKSFYNTMNLIDELSSIINTITDISMIFNLPQDPIVEIERAKGAHKNWVIRLYKMFYSGEKIEVDDLKEHTNCLLGRWYYGKGAKNYGNYEAFQRLEFPHKQIHHLAKEAVIAFKENRKDRALELIEQVDNVSSTIIVCLNQLQEAIKSGKKGGFAQHITGLKSKEEMGLITN